MDRKEKLEEIRKTVLKLREDRGISQRQVATAAGLDPGNYSRFEAGKLGLKVDSLFAIAEALNVEPFKLLGDYRAEFESLVDVYKSLPPDRKRRVLESAQDHLRLARMDLADRDPKASRDKEP